MQRRQATGPVVVIIGIEGSQDQVVAEGLQALGFRVIATRSTVEGLVAIEDRRPAVVVLRWKVDAEKRGTVIDSDIVLKAMQRALTAPPAVVAVVDSADEGAHALELGAKAYLTFNASGEQMLASLKGSLGQLGVLA